MPGINDESTTPNRDAALAGLSESGDSPGSTEGQGDPAGDGAGDGASGAAAGDAAGAGDGQGAAGADAAQGSEGEGSTPMARMASFLDGLSETPAGGKPAGDGTGAADPGTGAAGAAAGDGAAQAGATDTAAGDAAAGAAANPDDDEVQALEGVRSERGRARISKVFQERRELEADLGQIRDMVRGTGMTPNDFAQTLEFGRLANSQSTADVEVAIGMLESQRAALYAKLGREAPGVDLLKDHADLRAAVDGFEITRERAVELAGFRKAEADKQRAAQARQVSEREHQAYTATVQDAAKAMDTYLGTRANEVDHQARLNILGAHFKDPAKLQEFVTTYQPAQWVPVLKMMYDNARPPAQPRPNPNRERPISARPAALGAAATNANQAPIDRLASRLDAMGI